MLVVSERISCKKGVKKGINWPHEFINQLQKQTRRKVILKSMNLQID